MRLVPSRPSSVGFDYDAMHQRNPATISVTLFLPSPLMNNWDIPLSAQTPDGGQGQKLAASSCSSWSSRLSSKFPNLPWHDVMASATCWLQLGVMSAEHALFIIIARVFWSIYFLLFFRISSLGKRMGQLWTFKIPGRHFRWKVSSQVVSFSHSGVLRLIIQTMKYLRIL